MLPPAPIRAHQPGHGHPAQAGEIKFRPDMLGGGDIVGLPKGFVCR